MDLDGAGLFLGKKTSLHHLMKKMGFGYRHLSNKHNYYEQPRITEQRHSYLRQIEEEQNREKASGVS